MTPLEERLHRVELQLQTLTPSLSERLTRLEAALPGQADLPGPPGDARNRWLRAGKAFWGWLGPELPKFLTAAVLAFLAWGLKDSVDLAIQQRQLDLSYAKEMQALLLDMGKKDAELSQLEPTALVIASYGEPAVPALLNELSAGGLRAQAAMAGLRSMPPLTGDRSCTAVLRVLSTRGPQYDWLSQMNVVKLLGECECRDARQVLSRLRQKVDAASHGQTQEYAASVRSLPLSPAEEYPQLLAAIDHTLSTLRK